MNREEILNLGISDNVVKVKIKSVDIKDVPLQDKPAGMKVVLDCDDGTSSDKLHAVDEVWIKNPKTGQYNNKGLWITRGSNGPVISPLSGLGKLMQTCSATTLGALVDKEVFGIYKSNGFLVLLVEPHVPGNEYVSNR